MKSLKQYMNEDIIPYQALSTNNKISKSIKQHVSRKELDVGTFGIEFEFEPNQNWDKLFSDEIKEPKSFNDVYNEFNLSEISSILIEETKIGKSFSKNEFYKKIEPILHLRRKAPIIIFGIYYENINHKNIYTNTEQRYLSDCVSYIKSIKNTYKFIKNVNEKVTNLVKENLDVIEKFLLEAFKQDYRKSYYNLKNSYNNNSNYDNIDTYGAEAYVLPLLKLKWKVEEDNTPAMEFISPILTKKDIPALKHDMAILSKLSRSGSDNSAHVHIGKPKYKKFDHIALLGLFDENTFYTNEDVIGAGRSSRVRYWAETIKNYFNIVVPSGEYKFSYELSVNHIYEDMIYISYHKGVTLWKETTNGKTIEYRYPGANVLDDQNQFLQTIKYLLTVTHTATKINAMVIQLFHKNELLLLTRDSNKAYFLDLEYLNSIDYNGEDKKFIQWYRSNKYNHILNNYIKSYRGIDLNKSLG